jgi:long-chain acyl-CoA synthetase
VGTDAFRAPERGPGGRVVAEVGVDFVTVRPVVAAGLAMADIGAGVAAILGRRANQGEERVKELIYHRFLLPAVEVFADKVAFLDGAQRYSYAQHLERVSRLSSALRTELGIDPGDRFAVMACNSTNYLELWHAAFLGAGTINPLNLRLAPKELGYIVADSGSRVCFTDFLFAGLVDQVREEVGIEKVVLIGEGGDDVPHDVRYEDLIAAGDPAVPAEPEEETPVVLMYTGGTTGLPKGVLLDQRAEMLNLYHVRSIWPLLEDDIYLHQTPMFHAASMGGVLGIPANGGTTTFISLFDPVRVLDAIEEHQVTNTVMVPTMLGLVMNHEAYAASRLASLKTLTYGASPMPQALLQRLLADLPDVDIYQGYGMTEASAILTAMGPEDHRSGGARLRSAGKPVPGVILSIQDPQGVPVAQGETGEVCARAGNFMTEYWNKPEATAEVFRGGWYHSGDAGFLDADGYLHLVDRVKDMIVTGGENVYSIEVENAIGSYPGVAQVAVIGIPDDVWGEAVHAIVVPAPGVELAVEDLLDHARQAIAGYKVPKSVELRTDPLPTSGALKILKKDLRAPYWEGQDRGVG